MNQFSQTTYGGWGNPMNSFCTSTYGGWNAEDYLAQFVAQLQKHGYTTSYSICLENGGWAVQQIATKEIVKNPVSKVLETCGITSPILVGFMLSLQVLGHFPASCPNPTLRSGYLYILNKLEVVCKYQNLKASMEHGPAKNQYHWVLGKKDTQAGKKGYKSIDAWKGSKDWSDV